MGIERAMEYRVVLTHADGKRKELDTPEELLAYRQEFWRRHGWDVQVQKRERIVQVQHTEWVPVGS